jgi:hypothetical protein
MRVFQNDWDFGIFVILFCGNWDDVDIGSRSDI